MSNTITFGQRAQIAEILQNLENSPHIQRANRRRKTRARLQTAMSAILLCDDRQTEVRIFTRNLSTSGIGFVSRRAFKPGERLALSFVISNEESKLVLMNVTFVRYASGGMYEMGAEFIECIQQRDNSLPPQWITHTHR